MNTAPWTPRQKALMFGSPPICGLLGALAWYAADQLRYWRFFHPAP